MLLAALQGVDKAYGEQVLLAGANLELRSAERVALIGRNGSGKSTILRLLAGLVKPDGGTVHRAQETVVAYLEQNPAWAGTDKVAEVSARAFAELDELEERLAELEHAGLDDPNNYARWEELHGAFERRGGYARRARRDAVLSALGFAGRHEQPVAQLSGGERTRLGLAVLLMEQPDVLLLDEPTNHLDIEMRQWLEGHLSRYPGAALIVSHDRAFLDGATTRTAQVGGGRLMVGPGNPSAYLEARAVADRLQAETRANQERELTRLQGAADQMKHWAGQNAKLHRRAKAMQRRADRYEGGMVSELARAERTTRFNFPAGDSGDIVLAAEHLSKSFGERQLLKDATFELRRGDRIGLVGRNGEGKSTLLKMIVGELRSDDPRGHVRTGARVRLGYYDQELTRLDAENTLFDELRQRLGDIEAHNALGRFLFPYEAQFKKIRDLSGGERARLALLDLSLGEHNLLILDEPTNHLDTEMIAALEEALDVYEGTLLFVSHDRRFLSALAEQVWEVRDGKLAEYDGDWDYYLRHRPKRDAGAAREPAAPLGRPGRDAGAEAAASRGPSRWQLQRRLEALEEEIKSLEARLATLTGELAKPDELDANLLANPPQLAGPPLRHAELLALFGQEHAKVEEALLGLMEEWHLVTDQLAAA